MGYYRKRRKKHYSSSYDNELGEEIMWAVITIVVLYLLLWLLFWVWVVVLILVIGYLVHRLNKRFHWYNTKFLRAPIVSFFITISLLVVWWSSLLVHLGKIDKTFLDRAKEWSNYISIKYKKWRINTEPNIPGMVEKVIQPSIWITK